MPKKFKCTFEGCEKAFKVSLVMIYGLMKIVSFFSPSKDGTYDISFNFHRCEENLIRTTSPILTPKTLSAKSVDLVFEQKWQWTVIRYENTLISNPASLAKNVVNCSEYDLISTLMP